MPQPVVHFEVIGKDPERLRTYFGELFGWEFHTPSPVAREVAEPGSYGFLELVTAEDGTGIRGGVGGGPGYAAHAVFYVGVSNVEAALQRAEELGGTRVMGPAASPSGLIVGHFTDPEGTPDRRRGRGLTAAADWPECASLADPPAVRRHTESSSRSSASASASANPPPA